MARTHEEVRLGEPTNRASKVRAVDGEDLELLIVHIPNPARDVAGFAVPRIDHGILVCREPSLPSGKLLQPAKRKPRLITDLLFAHHGRKQITHDRHSQENPDDTVEKQAEFHEHRASGNAVFCTHRGSPCAGLIEEIGYGWPGNFGR